MLVAGNECHEHLASGKPGYIKPSCTTSLFCTQCQKHMQSPFGARLAKLYCDTQICEPCMHENQQLTVVACFEHAAVAAGDAWQICEA